MTGRERWRRIFKFQEVDRIFNCEFGWWSDTFKKWHKEGLPEDINTNPEGDRYFNFDKEESIPINLGLLPPFEEEIIEETERYVIKKDTSGTTLQIFKDGSSSILHYIKFPIETRNDWEEFKQKLQPDIKRRYPENWDDLKKEWENRNYPLGISVGSLFRGVLKITFTI